MLKSTLIGGGVAGVVGGLPVIGALNCACCALVVGGGFLAAYLYSRQCAALGVGFRGANGATVGLVAGLFYAIGHSVMGWLVQLALPTNVDQIIDQLDQAGMPPEQIEMVERVMETMTSPMGPIIGFFALLLIGALFSTIGGLIGGAAFKVEPTAPVAPGTAPPKP